MSPNRDGVAGRVDALTRLSGRTGGETSKLVVLTTVNAIVQRVPSRDIIRDASRSFLIGSRVDLEDLGEFFVRNGFDRAGTVREPGEYAIRGGILDIFPPGETLPVRVRSIRR